MRSAAPQNQGSGKLGKYMLLTIIVLLIGMVAYGFVPRGKNPDGSSKPGLFMALASKYIPALKGSEKPAEDLASASLDACYDRALQVREKAKAYVDDLQKYKDQTATLGAVEISHVLQDLERFREQVESGMSDLGRVVTANGKETKYDAATAKEEQKKQKEFCMEIGKALVKWKGPKDQIFSTAPDFVVNKFKEKEKDPEEKKPEGRKDPKRGETVVAPATPGDIPKPKEEPEKPKEEPKPEPKPEPEKPKEEPKPEPEKPKPVAKVDKPEPEKPKEEPKPEPKPEPEKPKPEPEKPKEEPKPEPKVERKVDVILADAEKLLADGTPLAKEILAATKNLPDDQEKLKTLSMKVETAQAFFVKARDTFASVKNEAPASADVATRMAKIEKILSILQNAGDGIKSKMK
jgi:hypothetical protein